MSREIVEVDFSDEVTQPESLDADLEVTFWIREPGTGWDEADDNFSEPEPELTDTPSVRFWVEPDEDIAQALYGVRVKMDLTDGRELVSDHPLDVWGSLS